MKNAMKLKGKDSVCITIQSVWATRIIIILHFFQGLKNKIMYLQVKNVINLQE